MTTMYIYLYGVAASLFLSTILIAYNWLTIPPVYIRNMARIGIHVSMIGEIRLCLKQRKTAAVVILLALLSWISVVANIFRFAVAIIEKLQDILFIPKSIRDERCIIRSMELTPEEIVMITLRMRARVTGIRFKLEDIEPLLKQIDVEADHEIERDLFFKLMRDNHLLYDDQDSA